MADAVAGTVDRSTEAEARETDCELSGTRERGLAMAVDFEIANDVRGMLVGIDALLINALTVCDGEVALRLCGSRELVAAALERLGSMKPHPDPSVCPDCDGGWTFDFAQRRVYCKTCEALKLANPVAGESE